MKILTPNEMARFLAQAKEEGYYEIFLLELSTGMRKGEILGLKWGDLNLGTGELRISREVVRANSKTLVTPPKMEMVRRHRLSEAHPRAQVNRAVMKREACKTE